ncbi:MAG: type II toxin-antitoxin system prevent-host-death family antitoxin [Lentisphaerae bacterium]|jgi:antitoxin (DNA-binding transcriptional repressor) of toxin-antitoxin stability system|nr:type II toxin-antitoxin system prevent-host-death family antitoxin [Lentisphaerota bacterium]MBT4820039.1 type II toxin-antitoxin system prevent-host-death family antitoxin [Lentisphaerota bacterium]MBT5609064.1 type II toxin-antitoxin system prevent-host-death family antitoxin [Lentisphaerota bacterium]MBT7053841.1 type II toxin-antitoxin system prevent-host-death family antitoxin [Lentisphaerota bacterium]MBT7842462.1 type II toxin-antitoxin system prevent-host-death family antitoxin [Lent
MTNVNIGDLKNHLSQFLLRVEQGDEVAVCKRNVPVAKITRLPRKTANRTVLGSEPGSATVTGDLTEPAMPASDWNMLGET